MILSSIRRTTRMRHRSLPFALPVARLISGLQKETKAVAVLSCPVLFSYLTRVSKQQPCISAAAKPIFATRKTSSFPAQRAAQIKPHYLQNILLKSRWFRLYPRGHTYTRHMHYQCLHIHPANVQRRSRDWTQRGLWDVQRSGSYGTHS